MSTPRDPDSTPPASEAADEVARKTTNEAADEAADEAANEAADKAANQATEAANQGASEAARGAADEVSGMGHPGTDTPCAPARLRARARKRSRAVAASSCASSAALRASLSCGCSTMRHTWAQHHTQHARRALRTQPTDWNGACGRHYYVACRYAVRRTHVTAGTADRPAHARLPHTPARSRIPMRRRAAVDSQL